MIVYFVRHAESVKTKEGEDRTSEPLSGNGIKQAESVGNRLVDTKIDVIYSSTNQRAEHTAKIISKLINRPIEHWDHLIEADLQKETFDKLNLRSGAILNHLLSHHKDQSVLCISHATMIETIIAKMIFGKDLSPEIMQHIRKHFGTTNTGISMCEFTQDVGWVLHSFNDSSHIVVKMSS